MDWTPYILGIIAAAILIPLVSYMSRRVINLFKTDTTEIFLKVPEGVFDIVSKFGLLYIRNGKDEISDRGSIFNKIIWFKKVNEKDLLKTTVRFNKKLGFQFKCFVDYKEENFNKLKKILEIDNKYINVIKGKGKSNRAWFIHNSFPICKTLNGIKNNFYYPQ